MFTCKGTTIYQNGVEICYIRAYHGAQTDKFAFTRRIVDGLAALDHAEALAKALTDLVGLVKAPDKNMQFYASQVRSTLREADEALLALRTTQRMVHERDLPEPTLNIGDIEVSARVFDDHLHELGLAATLDMPTIPLEPKTAIVAAYAAEHGIPVTELMLADPLPVEGHITPEATFLDDFGTVAPMLTLPTVTVVQRDAILAGLRLLQAALEERLTSNSLGFHLTDIVDNIAADSGQALSVEGIDRLCEAING